MAPGRVDDMEAEMTNRGSCQAGGAPHGNSHLALSGSGLVASRGRRHVSCERLCEMPDARHKR